METLAISFIDGGETKGSFSWSLANSLIRLKNKIDITHVIRFSSSNIPLNRSSVLKDFLENTDADWLLCIDSDIVFDPDHIEKIWKSRSETIQVISGVYFLLPKATNVMPVPMPCIFKPLENSLDKKEDRLYYHPLPENQIVEISRAGFGFILISRNVIEKILLESTSSPFEERFLDITSVVGEDFVFFENLDKLKIKAYADTSVIVGHEKKINVGKDYYYYYFKHVDPKVVKYSE